MIEIAQQQGHADAVRADRILHRFAQAFLERRPVRQAGQRVMMGEVENPVGRRTAFGDVLDAQQQVRVRHHHAVQ
jgi:hypothetical protein